MPPLSRASDPLDAGDHRGIDLDALFRHHGPTVRRALRRLGVDEASLDDAVQEVFVVLVRRVAAFDRQRSLVNWLWGIARGVASTHRRSRRRRDRLHAALPGHAELAAPRLHPDEAVGLIEAREVLDEFLDGLDSDKCAVFLMSELEGRTGPEIAAALEVNLNTVYARLRAARQRWASTVQEQQPRWIRALAAGFGPAAAGLSSMPWFPAAAAAAVAAIVVAPVATRSIEMPWTRWDQPTAVSSVESTPLELAAVRHRPPVSADDEVVIVDESSSREAVVPAKEEGEPTLTAAQENDTMRLPSAALAASLTLAPAVAAAAEPASAASDQDADIAAKVETAPGEVAEYNFENDFVEGERLAPDGSILLQRPQQRFPSMIDIRGHFLPELMWMAADV